MGQATERFIGLHKKVLGAAASKKRPPVFISKSYYKCRVSAKEIRNLVAEDQATTEPRQRVIYKVWPDFPVRALIDHSTTTV